MAVGTNGSASTSGTMSAHSSKLLNGMTSVREQVGAGSSLSVTCVRMRSAPNGHLSIHFPQSVHFTASNFRKSMLPPP